MQLFLVSSFLILLLCQTTLGLDFSHLLRSGKSYTDDTGITEMLPKLPLDKDMNDDVLQYSNYGLSVKNTSEAHRLDDENMDSPTNEISTSITDNNNQSHGIENSTNELKNDYSTSISTTQNTTGNSTTFSQSSQVQSSSESSTNASGQNDTKSETSIMTSSTKLNQSSTQSEDEEPEKVVIGTPSNSSSTVIVASQPKSLYQKTLELIQNDTYTLSILLPIAAGVVFASTIIVVIATCRCIRRQCLRRRLRKKTALPDSVKNLRPSDRARLLAESSDEEF